MINRAEVINELAGQIAQGNRDRGFWDDYEREVKNEATERAFVSQKVMLIVSELSEAVEELRSGRDVTETYMKDGKPEGFPVELADAMIRLLDLCGHVGIPVGDVLVEKVAFNATRGRKHGREF